MLLAMHWTDWFWIWITARLPNLFIYQFWKGRKQKKGNFIISSFIIRQTSSRTKWHRSFLVLFATEQLLPHFCVSSPCTYSTSYNILFLQRLKMKQTDKYFINFLRIRYNNTYTFSNFETTCHHYLASLGVSTHWPLNFDDFWGSAPIVSNF